MASQRRNLRRARFLSLSWVTGLVSGIFAATAGAAPTGVRSIDFVLVAIVAAAVTTAAAKAPWWALTGVCGVAAVSASRPGAMSFSPDTESTPPTTGPTPNARPPRRCAMA